MQPVKALSADDMRGWRPSLNGKKTQTQTPAGLRLSSKLQPQPGPDGQALSGT